MANTTSITVEEIVPEKGCGLLEKLFGGKSYMHCLMEIIKNCRDYGGTMIFLLTAMLEVTIIDNGWGMDKRRRKAFASVNQTTAQKSNQAGQFGTGTKQFLFSISDRVDVVSVPHDDPDNVYSFGFTRDEYETILDEKRPIRATIVPKTSANWPYSFATGTAVKFKLRDPKSRGIYRGRELATQLSARLPLLFEDIVRVDGFGETHLIPEKDVVGRFDYVLEDHMMIGRVAIELYQPRKKSSEEGLRIGATEIGEVSITDFADSLKQLGYDIPDVYFLPQVCGTIIAPFLRDYTMESRRSFKAEVVDDPRTEAFVDLLKDLAPLVEEQLKVKARRQEQTASNEEVMAEVAALINSTAPEGPTGGRKTGPRPPRKGGPAGKHEQGTIWLTVDRDEYEVGETITASFGLDKQFQSQSDEVSWLTERSRTANFQPISNGATLRVIGPAGHAHIAIQLPGVAGGSARAGYTVVEQRYFRLSQTKLDLPATGGRAAVFAQNTDKLTGTLRWKLTGDEAGRLEVDGNRVTYVAQVTGTDTIVAYDEASPDVQATCEVRVFDEVTDVIRIEDQDFQYRHTQGGNTPIEMIKGGRYHRLYINMVAEGYQAAAKQGVLSSYLLNVIVSAYVEFRRFILTATLDDQGKTYSHAEMKGVHEALRAETDQILSTYLKPLQRRS